MDIHLLLKGFVIGFSIAMAVGPIGLLCIRNSLTKGFLQGFATGLGAACADMLYGAIAGFGVVAITSLLVSCKMVLQIIGGLFLCYLGIGMLRVKKVREKEEMSPGGFWSLLTTTFFLTMTNPMTIVSFIAIYAGLGVGTSDSTLLSSCCVTGGVFIGSALFYILLSFVASRLKGKLTPAGALWLNRISGCIITGFGVASLASA